MGFKDKNRKIDIYFQTKEKLENKNLELEEIERELETKKSELKEIEVKISKKKSELESLKTEVIEIKDFINQKFKEDFKEWDYEVDITNCYIIGLNGKKYIALKKHIVECGDWYTLTTGYYNMEIYRYYDVLDLHNHKYKYLHEYRYGYNDYNVRAPRIFGQIPDYEKHILKAYPELSIFADNNVPNTYLKKIYYEVNGLSHKKLTKGHFE